MALMVKTTGIGSLPLIDIGLALDYSFLHDIPFFPQLLPIHGNMIEQVQNCNFKFLDKFIKRAKDEKIELVKIQLAGPTTTKLSKEHYQNCINYLHKHCSEINILFCIDEPILDETTLKKHIDYNLYNQFKYTGIHSCAKLTKEIVTPFLEDIDYFFYDLHLNPELIHIHKLCPGVIDFQEEMSKLNFSHCDIITTTCGLHNARSFESIQRIFSKLRSAINRT